MAVGEGAGGAIGEGVAGTAAGRDVTPQEMFQEFAAGSFNTPITLTYGALKEGKMSMIDNPNASVINQLNVRSKYEINGQKFSKEDFTSIIDRMTPEELNAANIKVEDDPATSEMVGKRFEAANKTPEPSLQEDVANAMSALNDEIKEVEAEIESMTESVGTESGLDVDQQQIDDARTKLKRSQRQEGSGPKTDR